MGKGEQRINRLDALVWKAKQLGISYGELSAQLSNGETEHIYGEYVKVVEERRQEEKMRLEQARLQNAKKKPTKVTIQTSRSTSHIQDNKRREKSL